MRHPPEAGQASVNLGPVNAEDRDDGEHSIGCEDPGQEPPMSHCKGSSLIISSLPVHLPIFCFVSLLAACWSALSEGMEAAGRLRRGPDVGCRVLWKLIDVLVMTLRQIHGAEGLLTWSLGGDVSLANCDLARLDLREKARPCCISRRHGIHV